MGNCIRCALFPSGRKSRKEESSVGVGTAVATPPNSPPSSAESLPDITSTNLKYFTYQSLLASTMNFHPSRLLGRGLSGSVFKGWIDPVTQCAVSAGNGVAIAIKMLDSADPRGDREWLFEVSKASEMWQQNIAKVLGYCIQGETRFLVCRYMQIGSLASVLFDAKLILKSNFSKKRHKEAYETLSWKSRGKIAFDIACGLKYLHESEPQVVYGDLKSTSVLLDSNYTATLSGFGLVNQVGGEVAYTLPGYAAPEYLETGLMTPLCDIYSFGVVLLELMSGRPSIDPTKYEDEIDLVVFAQPLARDTRLLNRFMDPSLALNFPQRDAYLAILLGLQCTGEPRLRPSPDDIIYNIRHIFSPHHDPHFPFIYQPSPSTNLHNPMSP